jgi:hypothetical protein
MTRQYRQGDSPARSIGRVPRNSVPSNGAGFGSRAVRDRGSGRNNGMAPAKREPGATLELLFRQNPDLKPGPFLAYVEQKYRLLGDIEMLREIRAYRAKHGL